MHIEVHAGDAPCRRCGGRALLSVLIPHQMHMESGAHIDGRRTVALCYRCDRNNMQAQGVLAFFAVQEHITTETVQQAGAVIHEWIERITAHPPAYTDAELDEDIRRWESGDM